MTYKKYGVLTIFLIIGVLLGIYFYHHQKYTNPDHYSENIVGAWEGDCVHLCVAAHSFIFKQNHQLKKVRNGYPVNESIVIPPSAPDNWTLEDRTLILQEPIGNYLDLSEEANKSIETTYYTIKYLSKNKLVLVDEQGNKMNLKRVPSLLDRILDAFNV